VFQTCFEITGNNAFVQILNDVESSDVSELVQHISEKLKACKFIFSSVGPLMNRLARVNPIFLVLYLKVIFQKTWTDTEVLSSQRVERLYVWQGYLVYWIKFWKRKTDALSAFVVFFLSTRIGVPVANFNQRYRVTINI